MYQIADCGGKNEAFSALKGDTAQVTAPESPQASTKRQADLRSEPCTTTHHLPGGCVYSCGGAFTFARYAANLHTPNRRICKSVAAGLAGLEDEFHAKSHVLLIDNISERDVMRLTWEIIDNLERIGHADLDGIFRRRSEKPVVPSAAVAKARAIEPCGKSG